MKRLAAWSLAILNLLCMVYAVYVRILTRPPASEEVVYTIGFLTIAVVASLMGAWIVARTDGNRIGWLMLGIGFFISNPFATYLVQVQAEMLSQITPLMVFSYWTQGWFFFVPLYAAFLILLHFPNGHPLTPRWRWLNWTALISFGQFIVVYTFQPTFGDADAFTSNPLARLPIPAEDTASGLAFGLGLILVGLSSMVSIFIRYRRAGLVERAQIKWLFFFGIAAIAAIAYRLATYDPTSELEGDWRGYLISVALLLILIGISIAVLRYRLYDIEIIIRRTVQYALLTGLLVVFYFGGVIVLQGLLESVLGEANQPLVTVITTLGIAALFNPLRTRVQAFIDRRFFRRKYDAENALSNFALIVRDEVDVKRLSGDLITLIDKTMHPDKVSIWLRGRGSGL